MNLVNVGDERLEKFGDTRAYIFEGQEFTSSQLTEMSRKLAAGLKSLGIGRGDRVVVALMIYTSGTTGRPKGAMLSHNNLYRNALSAYEANEATKGDIALLCLPLVGKVLKKELRKMV